MVPLFYKLGIEFVGAGISDLIKSYRRRPRKLKLNKKMLNDLLEFMKLRAQIRSAYAKIYEKENGKTLTPTQIRELIPDLQLIVTNAPSLEELQAKPEDYSTYVSPQIMEFLIIQGDAAYTSKLTYDPKRDSLVPKPDYLDRMRNAIKNFQTIGSQSQTSYDPTADMNNRFEIADLASGDPTKLGWQQRVTFDSRPNKQMDENEARVVIRARPIDRVMEAPLPELAPQIPTSVLGYTPIEAQLRGVDGRVISANTSFGAIPSYPAPSSIPEQMRTEAAWLALSAALSAVPQAAAVMWLARAARTTPRLARFLRALLAGKTVAKRPSSLKLHDAYTRAGVILNPRDTVRLHKTALHALDRGGRYNWDPSRLMLPDSSILIPTYQDEITIFDSTATRRRKIAIARARRRKRQPNYGDPNQLSPQIADLLKKAKAAGAGDWTDFALGLLRTKPVQDVVNILASKVAESIGSWIGGLFSKDPEPEDKGWTGGEDYGSDDDWSWGSMTGWWDRRMADPSYDWGYEKRILNFRHMDESVEHAIKMLKDEGIRSPQYEGHQRCALCAGDRQAFYSPGNLKAGRIFQSGNVVVDVTPLDPTTYGEVIVDGPPFSISINSDMTRGRARLSLAHELMHVLDLTAKTNMTHEQVQHAANMLVTDIVPAMIAFDTHRSEYQ